MIILSWRTAFACLAALFELCGTPAAFTALTLFGDPVERDLIVGLLPYLLKSCWVGGVEIMTMTPTPLIDTTGHSIPLRESSSHR